MSSIQQKGYVRRSASTSEFLGYAEYEEAINDYKTPHVDSPEWFHKNKSSEDQHRDLPANGFKLNVAVRYDSLFARKFPSSTVAKYISINVSWLNLLELGNLGGVLGKMKYSS